MLNFGEMNYFVLLKRLAPVPLGTSFLRTRLVIYCHRFGGAAFAYQQQGAPIAVSGSAIWENRDDKICEGAGIPPKKCNVGTIAASCDLLKYLSKGCEL